MPHINGDVTGALHCTLFFGINPNLIKDDKLSKIVKNADFKEITLGKIMLINGYQGLYKILSIEVIDKDNQFSKFTKEVEVLINDKDVKYETKPHITLAYVAPEYKIEKYPQSTIKKLKSKNIQISIQGN